MFLTLLWIEKIYNLYREREALLISDKSIVFSAPMFLATLLQIYRDPLGDKILNEYFSMLSQKEKELVKKGFSHLLAQDLLSIEFTKWFRDNLIKRDYEDREYFSLVYQFLQLKEQLRKQVQIPLLDDLKKLCVEMEAALEENREVSEAQKKRLRRIYNFFKRVNLITPTKISDLLERVESLWVKMNEDERQEIPYEKIKNLMTNIKDAFEEELKNLINRVKL